MQIGDKVDEIEFLRKYYPDKYNKETNRKQMSFLCLNIGETRGAIIVHSDLNILFKPDSPVHILLLGGSYSVKESEDYYSLNNFISMDLFFSISNSAKLIEYMGKFNILGRTSDIATIEQLKILNSKTKGDYKIHSALYLISTDLVRSYIIDNIK